jgi:hypothetical protein
VSKLKAYQFRCPYPLPTDQTLCGQRMTCLEVLEVGEDTVVDAMAAKKRVKL